MTGTRCPACDFFNHQDATASDTSPDAPVQCNACTRSYYQAVVAAGEAGEAEQAVRLLESSRIVWRRDWDAVAVGFACGVMSDMVDMVGAWIADWLR